MDHTREEPWGSPRGRSKVRPYTLKAPCGICVEVGCRRQDGSFALFKQEVTWSPPRSGTRAFSAGMLQGPGLPQSSDDQGQNNLLQRKGEGKALHFWVVWWQEPWA